MNMSEWRELSPEHFALTQTEALALRELQNALIQLWRGAKTPTDPPPLTFLRLFPMFRDTCPAPVIRLQEHVSTVARRVLRDRWFTIVSLDRTPDGTELLEIRFSSGETTRHRLEKPVEQFSGLPALKTALGIGPEWKHLNAVEHQSLVDTLEADGIAPENLRYSIVQSASLLPDFSGLRQSRAKPPQSPLSEFAAEISDPKGGIVLWLADDCKLSESAKPLLLSLLAALAENGMTDRCVTISLPSYMSERGITSREYALRQLAEDLRLLQTSLLEYRRGRATVRLNILDKSVLSNGSVRVWFSASAIEYLQTERKILPHFSFLQQLNARRNPYAFALGLKIECQKWMNRRHGDVVSVKALLESAQFPTKGEVRDRHYRDRIILPFLRDMDALAPILSYRLCRSDGTPLGEDDLAALTYDTFVGLKVRVSWKVYPEIEQKERKKRTKKAGG